MKAGSGGAGDRSRSRLTDHEIQEAVGEVVSAVDSCFPIAFRQTTLPSFQYAAAGVARCSRLLASMLATFTAGEHEGTGAILRVLQDATFATLFLLYGKMPALERMARSDWRYLTDNARHLGTREPAWPPGNWPSTFSTAKPLPRDRMTPEDLRRALSDVLNAEADEQDNVRQFVDESYKSVYKIWSHLGVHPSVWVVLAQYRVSNAVTQDDVVVSRPPRDSIDPQFLLMIGGKWVGSTAYRVFYNSDHRLMLDAMLAGWRQVEEAYFGPDSEGG